MQRHHVRTIISLVAAGSVFTASLSLSNAKHQMVDVKAQTVTNKVISFASHNAHVYGIAIGGTTYMPIWYVMHALSSVGFRNTWNGGTWNFTTPSSSTVNLNGIHVGTGNASLILNGTLVHHVQSVTRNDPNSGQPTAYMPIWYVMQMLDRAGVHSTWNGTTWALSTGTSLPASPRWDVAFVTNETSSLDDVATARTNVNTLIPSAFDVNADATLSGDSGHAATVYAHAHGMRSIGRVSLSNPATLNAILSNSTLSSQLVANLAKAIVAAGYDGVNIDFEQIPPADRNAFSSFLQQLGTTLHTQGKLLAVDLPAVINPANESWNQGYDFAKIGSIVDKVIVMAYDYSYPTSKPGAIAPLWWVAQAVEYAVAQMSPAKVLLGLDTYAYDWSKGRAKAYSLTDATRLAAEEGVTPTWDTFDEAPTFTYTQNGVAHTVYYESAQSLTPKIALATQFNLGGIAVWRAGLEDKGSANALNTFH